MKLVVSRDWPVDLFVGDAVGLEQAAEDAEDAIALRLRPPPDQASSELERVATPENIPRQRLGVRLWPSSLPGLSLFTSESVSVTLAKPSTALGLAH